MSAATIPANGTVATYRFSALGRALLVMWRSSRWCLPAVVVGALLQALLIAFDIQSALDVTFALTDVASGVALLALYAVLVAGALHAVDPQTGVLARIGEHPVRFLLWALVQWALAAVAVVIQPGLVLIVAAVTAFLPFAAMTGATNPLAGAVRAIAAAPWRWLVTSLILAALAAVLYLAAALNTFFVTGGPAAFLFWVAAGILAWWILTAWALIYRQG